MSLDAKWEKAVHTTQIVRPRIKPLSTYEATRLPYVFLAEAPGSDSRTLVRKGEVVVERPQLVLPSGIAQFEGFDFESAGIGEDFLKTFFLVRGIRFPSFKYANKTEPTEVREERLSAAVARLQTELGRKEDVHTGLFTGDEDVWPLAVLLFTCGMAFRSADLDVRRLFEGPGLS